MNTETIETLIKSLHRNRIHAKYYKTQDELLASISEHFNSGAIVGVGDSQTLEALGIYNLLKTKEVEFLDKYKTGQSREEKNLLYRRNFSADIFISGINAITLEGKIFNLDGNGSRVAPIIYGPKKVLLVCGTNKIVKNDEEAVVRIKNIAAPIDAKRLNKKTPCVKTGRCMNCSSTDKICNYYTIIQGQFDENRIEVFVIDGEYGY
ncbi:MAG: lactate utilization protein [Spirochaetales bacterium]|nr:lactate utilization protein [Spirochaetales bacterium]